MRKIKTPRTNPKQSRSEETTRLLLVAMAEMLASDGYSTLTTNKIAAHAGVPVGTVYRYYRNIDDMLDALADLYGIDMAAAIKRIGQHPILERHSLSDVMTMVVFVLIDHDRHNATIGVYSALRTDTRKQAALRRFIGYLCDEIRSLLSLLGVTLAPPLESMPFVVQLLALVEANHYRPSALSEEAFIEEATRQLIYGIGAR